MIQASDALVLTHNRHVLHIGFEFWRDRINTFYTGNSGALGAIIFNGAFTSSDPTNATTPTGGYGGADFYLGLPASYGKGVSTGQWGQRANIFAGYVAGRLESHRKPYHQPGPALRSSHAMGRGA